MDINPEDFIDFQDYAFASYCASHSIDVILFSSAWLMPENEEEDAWLPLDRYW
jgi:hypothetical protein